MHSRPQLPVSLPSGVIRAALVQMISDATRAKDSRQPQPTEPTICSTAAFGSCSDGLWWSVLCRLAAYWASKFLWAATPVPTSSTDLNKTYMEHIAKHINVFSVNNDSERSKSPSGMDVEPSRQGEHAKYIRRLDGRWRFDAVDLKLMRNDVSSSTTSK